MNNVEVTYFKEKLGPITARVGSGNGVFGILLSFHNKEKKEMIAILIKSVQHAIELRDLIDKGLRVHLDGK